MERLLVKFVCISSVLLALLLSHSVYGQKRMDVVHLKNGNVLKGNITEFVPGEYVKIQSNDSNVWTFEMSEIARIEFQDPGKGKNIALTESVGQAPHGYFNLTQLGILEGDKDDEIESLFSVMMINGYRFKNGLAIGVGVGLEAFSETQLPVVGDIRYFFRNQGIAPFLFAQAGYSFALQNKEKGGYWGNVDYDSKGGYLFNPGMGVAFQLKGKTYLDVGLGFRYQELEHEGINSYTEDQEELTETFKRFSIQLGLRF